MTFIITLNGVELDGTYSSDELFSIIAGIRQRISSGKATMAYRHQRYDDGRNTEIDKEWVRDNEYYLDNHAKRHNIETDDDEAIDTTPQENYTVDVNGDVVLRDAEGNDISVKESEPAYPNLKHIANEAMARRDAEKPRYRVDKQELRGHLREMIDGRINDFFHLREDPFPLEVVEGEDPNYSNDAIELAVVDGYLTVDEIVADFRSTLARMVRNAAQMTYRDADEAENRTHFDPETARNHPSFLKNYNMFLDGNPPGDDDDSWREHVPESMILGNDDDYEDDGEALF